MPELFRAETTVKPSPVALELDKYLQNYQKGGRPNSALLQSAHWNNLDPESSPMIRSMYTSKYCLFSLWYSYYSVMG